MDLSDLKNIHMNTWLKLVNEIDIELAELKMDLIKLRSIIEFAKKELKKELTEEKLQWLMDAGEWLPEIPLDDKKGK